MLRLFLTEWSCLCVAKFSIVLWKEGGGERRQSCCQMRQLAIIGTGSVLAPGCLTTVKKSRRLMTFTSTWVDDPTSVECVTSLWGIFASRLTKVRIWWVRLRYLLATVIPVELLSQVPDSAHRNKYYLTDLKNLVLPRISISWPTKLNLHGESWKMHFSARNVANLLDFFFHLFF